MRKKRIYVKAGTRRIAGASAMKKPAFAGSFFAKVF